MHLDRPIPTSISILVLATLLSAATADAQNPRRIRVTAVPDLTPSVSQSSNPVVPGRSQSYTITVRNSGGAPSPSFGLETRLPNRLVPAGVEETDGFECDVRDLFAGSGRVRNCEGPALEPGESASFTVRADVPEAAPPGESIVFSVHVDRRNTVREASDYNNWARAVAQIGEIPRREYVVPFDRMRGEAMLHGWQFQSQACRFSGSFVVVPIGFVCNIRLFHRLARRPRDGSGITGGQTLTPPWRVKRVLFYWNHGSRSDPLEGPDSCVELADRYGDGGDPAARASGLYVYFRCIRHPENDPDPMTAFRVTKVEMERGVFDFGGSMNLKIEYVLEGPEGRDWREAFE